MTIANILLAAFLILFGLTLILSALAVPGWVSGLLAVGAGIMLLVGR